MKVTQLETIGLHAEAIGRGWVEPAGTEVVLAYPPLERVNGSGAALVEGDVVVIDTDGEIITTTTAQDTRPIGIVLDDIAIGESGPVAVIGPVDLIRVTASVTAGDFAETSTTAGLAQASASRREGSFGFFTSTGTSPSGWLFGITDSTATFASGDFVLTYNGGEEQVSSHGSMGATETIDLANGNWHRGTLNADCTFTFTGATNGLGCSFTLFLTEDGTGGWAPTWPASVVWIGGTAPTHPTTASSTTIYVFLSYDGGTTWFGAQAGGSGEGGHYEVLMTGASPAEPLEDGSGVDWLYVFVP